MESKARVIGESLGKDANESGKGAEGSTEGPEEDNLRVLSVDKVIVEKYVLEGNGSREVLLTKNESSRRLSVESEPGSTYLRRSRDEKRESSSNSSFRVSLPRDPFTSKLADELNAGSSKLPVTKNRRNSGFGTGTERRIKPIKLTKAPSIGSLTPANYKTFKSSSIPTKRNKVPPKVPDKPDTKKLKKSVGSSNPLVKKENAVAEESLNSDTSVGKKVLKTPEERGDVPECLEKDKKKEDDARDIVEKDEKEIPPIENAKVEAVNDESENHEAETKDVSDREDVRSSRKVDIDVQDLLERSQSKIEVLQKKLGTKIRPSTAQSYKEKLLGLRSILVPKVPSPESRTSNEKTWPAVKFDEDFIEKHNLDKRLRIEEKRFLETDLDYPFDPDKTGVTEDQATPRYSEKVSEVEKRWSGDFLQSRLDRNSSESSKSSYVEELGSVSSRESIVGDNHVTLLPGYNKVSTYADEKPLPDEDKQRSSGEILGNNSTVSTVDSDSCFEDRIKAADEIIDNIEAEVSRIERDKRAVDEEIIVVKAEEKSDLEVSRTTEENSRKEEKVPTFFPPVKEEDPVKSLESSFLVRGRSRGDGYANLIREFTMEAGSSRMKKEEKQKKKLGFRRLLPGFFSPKDSRKEYSKKEQKERRRHDDRHFARYQQNGSYTRSPDTLNLNEDIKRNVKLDTSLNGSIIEERLDEIKRELFPEQGLITSTPDHFSQMDDQLLHDRSRVPRCYTTDSSLSSIAPEDRWIDRGIGLGGSPDIRKYEQRQKRDDQRRYGQLERKHSLQEPNNGGRNFVFVRNHGPSGRISAPPGERFLVRPRAVHPVDRPLPAIPRSRVELSNYENYRENTHYLNQPGFYENGQEQHMDSSNLILTPVSAQVKITRQPIVNQNQKAPLVGRSPKYPSPGSSQKSGDYADSSCTPNSSQKSEFSPTSSKSGEYYLNSPRNSSRASPNDRGFGDLPVDDIYENEDPASPSKFAETYTDERVYDETPASPSYLSNSSREEKYSTTLQAEKCWPSSQEKDFSVTSPRERRSPSCQKYSRCTEQQNYSPRREQRSYSPAFRQEQRSCVSPSVNQQKYSPSWQQQQQQQQQQQKASSNSQSEKRSPKAGPMENRGREESPCKPEDRSNNQLHVFIESTEKTLGSSDDRSKVDEGTGKMDDIPSITITDKSTPSGCSSSEVVDNFKTVPPTSPLQCRTSPVVTSPSGSRVPVPSRRSQPNDQILIASPKREALYDNRTHMSAKESEQVRPESPVPRSGSTDRILGVGPMDQRNREACQSSPSESTSSGRGAMSPSGYPIRPAPEDRRSESTGRRAMSPNNYSPVFTSSNTIQRPEPVYGTRKQACLPISESVERISGVASLDPKIQDTYNSPKSSPTKIPPPSGRRTLSPCTVPRAMNESQGSTSTGRRTPSNFLVSSSNSDLQHTDPVYGSRRQPCPRNVSSPSSETRNEGRDQVRSIANSESPGENQPSNETAAWVQSQTASTSSPRNLMTGQEKPTRDTSFEEPVRSNRLISGSPARESPSLQAPSVRLQCQQGSNLPQDLTRQAPRSAPHRSNLPVSQERVYASRGSLQRDPIYEQQQRLQEQLGQGQDSGNAQRPTEALYGQQPQSVGAQQGSTQCGPPSPSKKQMMQHLEAFYWQQKALEAQRKCSASPANASLRRNSPKIDMPQVREAVYWQQLKKLDEEQQRRIYEQNLLEEKMYEQNQWKAMPKNSLPSVSSGMVQGSGANGMNQSGHRSQGNPDMALNYEDRSYWGTQQRGKVNPTGKPPLMQAQKGQNQPVLIVRPQQAIRQRHEIPAKAMDSPDSAVQDALRAKSASPHFHRNEMERLSYNAPRKSNADGAAAGVVTLRKPETSYDEAQQEGEGKPTPPPIFKRGSLIGGENVEYGSTGPKRVSFSNQSNSGQDMATGNWPTKHGTAPEPPTRRHKSEDCSSDNDSVFSHSDSRNQESPYGVSGLCGKNLDLEYDANRPLPPPPKEYGWLPRRSPATLGKNMPSEPRWNPDVDPRRTISPANYKKWPTATCESESGSETAGEVQRIFRPPPEEEWNPDGKGRQSNDTGGSGRAEGEPGSNELSSAGRRSAGGGGGGVLGIGGVGRTGSGSGGGGRSRDEPRRHTLGGDHQPSLHHQQFNAAQQLHPLHPHHLPPPHGQYGTPPARHTTMDLEMGTKSRQRKSPLPRGYPPPSSAMLFDDDPGIMSEVETSSTGFRRGGKQRSSLPVVRTPSKTLERPLGLVFLQYRNETKRALLPNEITSIDTVKALFVRSFPKQLTMEYLDSPHVKVYIHDSNKDMFYELEDLRSHLRDIRDRSVLRLFESTDGVTGMPGPLGVPGGGAGLPPHWEDQSYFSEPEFDSEYQHQHIHKSKTAKNSTSGGGGYYVGGSSTLPRGGPLLRAYSPAASSVVAGPNSTPTQPKTLTTPGGGGVPPAKPLRSYQCGKSPLGSLGGSARFSRDSSVSLYSIPDRLHGESGYMSSPERGGGVGSGTGRYPPGPYSAGSSYEDPYYSQYSGTVTPVIDEEASDTELLEESYSLYGVKPAGRPTSGPPRSPFPPGAPAPLPPGGPSYDVTRIRVEHMERQLANLTGLVQKALTHAPHPSPSPRDYLQVPAGRDPYARSAGAGDEFDKHSSSSSASLPDKSVSFEKSVSFSDEPPDMNSPKQHSPQHAADTKPAKPAIKSSTLPRMSSQERDRHKPTPPPKPAALVAGQYVYRDLSLTPEMYNQLRGLQKKAKDLRQEVRNLRRMSQAQAHTVKETIRDTFITIRAMLLSGVDATWMSGDAEKVRLSREEDLYKQEMIRLEKDLTELESTVEELRGNVINRKTRVNMSDVENMALILSKSSKTVADLKVRFPSLQEGMKGLLSSEMEKVVREEKFLKEEPERLESALRRCKKLTGTLVTLKRLASVQEQRLPNASSVDAEETPPITPTSAQHSKTVAPVPAERTVVGSASVLGGGSHPHEPPPAHQQRPENALDALLDELQTFSRPGSQLGHSSGPSSLLSDIGRSASREVPAQQVPVSGGTRPPSISDIGRKSSVDSSTGMLSSTVSLPGQGGTLRRLHSYPSSSDTDTSPPIARLQVSLQEQPGVPVLPAGLPGQKPPVPERNAELLQLASARRVPPPPPPRTSSRSPLASPTSPQLPPRNPCAAQNNNATLRRPAARGSIAGKECKPPMALPPDATTLMPTDSTMGGIVQHNSTSSQSSAVLSTSNSSSCESVNSQEGLQSKRGRQEQLEQRHQELLRKQKALQEQYARLQQLQRNAAGLTTVPPTPPDLLKKTGSESNLLAKMGLGLSTASSGSLTSLTIKPPALQDSLNGKQNSPRPDLADGQASTGNSNVPAGQTSDGTNSSMTIVMTNAAVPATSGGTAVPAGTGTTTTSKIYETDIL